MCGGDHSEAGVYEEGFLILCGELLDFVLVANLHRHHFGKFGVGLRAHQIIKRSVAGCAVVIDKGEILPVGVIVSNEEVEDDLVEYSDHVDTGMRVLIPELILWCGCRQGWFGERWSTSI